jgi:hypothetical protein
MSANAVTATTPQAPIAAGPFESIVEVLRAAHVCGVLRLRIDSEPSDFQGEARLFLDQEPTAEAWTCLNSWTTRSGKRLRLQPRWQGDTFEQDAT